MTGARGSTDWRSDGELWLDHVVLASTDAEWLAPVRSLTLWAVTVPEGLLASLPHLAHLDVRGGSGESLAAVAGCRGLRSLQVNQVRGLTDLDLLPTLRSLEMLVLYGLPRVVELPSFRTLDRLLRVELGSMKGLAGLTGLHDAPALEELLLVRAVGVAGGDAGRLAGHPTLQQFDWFGEDVPVNQWLAFREAVGRPRARAVHAVDWFAGRSGS
jgi:hypothetical protein